MFEGKRFLPETGTPMRKMDRMRTLFAVCEPDPLAVATCSEKSLATTSEDAPARDVVSVRTLDMLVFPPGPRPSMAPAGRGKMRRDLNSARARMEESRRAHRVAVPVDHGEPRRAGPRREPRRRHALLHSPARGARRRPAGGRHEEPRSRGDSRPRARPRFLQLGGEPGGGHFGAETGVPGRRLAREDGGGDPGPAATLRFAYGQGEGIGRDFFESGRGS